MKNKAAQELARQRHEKNPVDPEFMREIGRKGAQKRWAKHKKEKYDIQNKDVDSDQTTQV